MKSFFLLVITGCLFQAHTPGHFTPAVVAGPSTDSIMGIFVGRTPCKEIARELDIAVTRDCQKLKWKITFYQHPVTHTPTTYEISRTLSRSEVLHGSWSILKGTKAHPRSEVYQLVSAKDGSKQYFLKGDENVLFFLDKQMKPLVGNELFSYTMNRLIPGEE